jgi:hypothetical protein
MPVAQLPLVGPVPEKSNFCNDLVQVTITGNQLQLHISGDRIPLRGVCSLGNSYFYAAGLVT